MKEDEVFVFVFRSDNISFCIHSGVAEKERQDETRGKAVDLGILVNKMSF